MHEGARDGLGKYVAQIVQGVVEFRGDGRSRNMDLPRAPQVLQPRLDLMLQAVFFPGRVGRVFVPIDQTVDFPVQFAHSGTFRFRRVSRQHGLDRDVAQNFEHLCFRKSGSFQSTQVIRPQPFFRRRPFTFFPLPSRPSGRTFFNDVEQLKRDRIGLFK